MPWQLIASVTYPRLARSPRSFWAAIKPEVMKKLDDDGPPDSQAGDSAWTSQADLERFIAQLVLGRLDKSQIEPSESRVRHYAGAWLKEFCATREAQGL